MAMDGDYPLLVYVWNRFGSSSGIEIDVTFYHWPNFENPYPEDPDDKPTNENIYTIKPGDSLVFPLYWVNEYLTIRIGSGNVPKESYYISMDAEAKYTSDRLDKDTNGVEFTPSGTADYIARKYSEMHPSHKYSSKSGIWKIKEVGLDWSINVGKLLFDPQTTNVSIGQDIP